MRRLFFSFSLCLSICFSSAQNTDLSEVINWIIQNRYESLPYGFLYENLLLKYEEKININTATYDDLMDLKILSAKQAGEIIKHRENYNLFISVYELQSIPSLDVQTIRFLLPFVTVDHSLNRFDSSTKKGFLIFRYYRDLQKEKGYLNGQYKGSPNELYTRIKIKYPKGLGFGLTLEKDGGEQLTFNGVQKGFDFYSYHLMIEKKIKLDKIIVGDFQLQTGQGLIFGAGISFGKSASTVLGVPRYTSDIRPYTSSLESGFFRGIGIQKKIKKISLTLFYSNIKNDARISSIPTTDDIVLSTYSNGLHRTDTEINNKDKLREQNIGISINFTPHQNLKIGYNGLFTFFDTYIRRRPRPYNFFEYSGKNNNISSLFFNYSFHNIFFFGEVAKSLINGAAAKTAGLLVNISDRIDLSILLRDFDKNFHSTYGNAFAESSRVINEKGIYLGLATQLHQKHKLNFFYDSFNFPWLKYQINAPSYGNEFFGRYTGEVKNVNYFVGYNRKETQFSNNEGVLSVLQKKIKHRYYINIKVSPRENITLNTRIQWSNQTKNQEKSEGLVISQDLLMKVNRFNFNLRYAIFETSNFDNAQYILERDLLYTFRIPPYHGKGIRTYFLIKYKVSRQVSCWFKLSRFYYPTVSSIGSGNSEILGKFLDEIRYMIKINI